MSCRAQSGGLHQRVVARLTEVVLCEYDIWYAGLSRGHMRDDWCEGQFFFGTFPRQIPILAARDVIFEIDYARALHNYSHHEVFILKCANWNHREK
jgi:hypothetical protein